MKRYLVMMLFGDDYRSGFLLNSENAAAAYINECHESAREYVARITGSYDGTGLVTLFMSNQKTCASSVIELKSSVTLKYIIRYEKDDEERSHFFNGREEAIKFAHSLASKDLDLEKSDASGKWTDEAGKEIILYLTLDTDEEVLEFRNSDMRDLFADYPSFAREVWGEYDEEKAKKELERNSASRINVEKGIIDILLGVVLLGLGIALNWQSSETAKMPAKNGYRVQIIFWGPCVVGIYLVVKGLARCLSGESGK